EALEEALRRAQAPRGHVGAPVLEVQQAAAGADVRVVVARRAAEALDLYVRGVGGDLLGARPLTHRGPQRVDGADGCRPGGPEAAVVAGVDRHLELERRALVADLQRRLAHEVDPQRGQLRRLVDAVAPRDAPAAVR